MINEVRNAVMAVINKNNYGYISPSDFNLFAEQAQLDIFEDYFYLYNNQLNSEVMRKSGTGYANITKGIVENFLSTVTPGSLVVNTTISLQAFVVTVDSDIQLTLSSPIIASGQNYSIYSNTNIREVERVTQNKIFYLTNSNIAAPNTMFPAYVLDSATGTALGNTVTVYPTTITGAADIHAQYVRYPLAPKWTYTSLAGGEPVFNASATDYQDFELPISDMNGLVNKILQYAGVSVREANVTKFGQSLEAEDRLTEQ